MTELIIKNKPKKPPQELKVGDWFSKPSPGNEVYLYTLVQVLHENAVDHSYVLVNVSYGNIYTYTSSTKEGAFAGKLDEFTKVDKVTLEVL